ncbi:hypothetical protein MNBD_GAMMA10-2381 [hydrothermal vent metagenome]|uniref:Uncharacterized protein n=1 Tax=hydrothermal vent metagenome TaxID=652676 RepID=A0A3B0XYA7_9ZZZZ
MEIALTGFNPQFDSSTSVEALRQRQRQQQDAQRPSERQDRPADNEQTRAQNNSGTPAQTAVESARVITGEVLSSETVRVSARSSDSRAGASVLARDAENEPSAFNEQATNRRIPVEQAIQTFQDNELLVLAEANPRQVSGIINEFV